MIVLIPKWVWIVVAIVLVLVGVQCYRSRNADKKADADVTRSQVVDAAHKAQTGASARVDTLVDTVIVHDRALTSHAGELRRASDTAGSRAATLVDSSAMWHLRWQLIGMAYDTLSRAHMILLVAVDSLTADRGRWKAVADSATASQDRLRADLAVARSGCRILPFVPCPSRKVALLGGLAAGVALTRRYWRN